MEEFLRWWLRALLPDLPVEQLLMDRYHRALCPRPPTSKSARDVILRLHYNNTKEALLRATCEERSHTFENMPLQMFQDLAPSTLAERRNLRPVTNILRDKGVSYCWVFPCNILVSREGHTHALRDLDKAATFWEIPKLWER
ncbi:hypothetical protein FKM82_019799 [Ascaphus truei]